MWFKKTLIGRENFLIPIIYSILNVTSAEYLENTIIAHITISNNSDAPLTLKNKSKYDFYNLKNHQPWKSQY